MKHLLFFLLILSFGCHTKLNEEQAERLGYPLDIIEGKIISKDFLTRVFLEDGSVVIINPYHFDPNKLEIGKKYRFRTIARCINCDEISLIQE